MSDLSSNWCLSRPTQQNMDTEAWTCTAMIIQFIAGAAPFLGTHVLLYLPRQQSLTPQRHVVVAAAAAAAKHQLRIAQQPNTHPRLLHMHGSSAPVNC